jgi:hypothetical protein
MRATLEADFNEFLSDLDKVSVKLRDKFSGDVDRASGRLQRLTDSLDGNKTLQQAGLMVSALARVGGAATLTDREIARIGPTVDEAVQKFQRLNRDVPKDLAALKTELDRLRQPLVAAKADAEGLGGVLSGLSGAVAQGLGIGVGVGIGGVITDAVAGAVSQIKDISLQGQQLSALSRPFEALQGGAGRAESTLRELKNATRGLVSELDLLQASNKAQLLGLTDLGVDLSDLAGVATKLGRAMGQDAAKSVDDLTTALGRSSPQILDNLGITVRVGEANEKFAASIGTTADALTDQQQKLAFTQAAMDAARVKAAALGDAGLTVGDQFARIGNTLNDAVVRLASAGNESGILTRYLGVLAEGAERAVATFDDIRGELAQLLPSLSGVGAAFDALTGSSENSGKVLLAMSNGTLFVLNEALEQLQSGLRGARLLWDDLTGAFSNRALSDAVGGAAPPAAPGVFNPETLAKRGLGASRYDFVTLMAGGKERADAEQKEWARIQAEIDRKNEADAKKRDQERQRLADARQQRVDKLVGRTVITDALTSFDDLASVNLSGSKDSVLKVFDDLVQAREVAKRIEPAAVAGITGLLETLATKPEVAESVRKAGAAILKPLSDPAQLNTLLTQGSGFKNAGVLAGKDLAEGITGGLSRLRNGRVLNELAIFTLPKIDIANSGGQYAAVADNAERTTLIFQEMKKSLEGLGIPLDDITKRTQKAIAQGRDWRGAVSGVAQAFAQLSQIAGGAFDDISRTIGTVFGAADAALETVTALGKQFQSLLKRDQNGNVLGLSSGGRALAGGLAGLGIGSQLGGLFTNRGAGFAAGAAGGAGAGFMAGGLLGAGVGALVGGFAGMFAAAANASARRAAKDISASQLTSQFGGLEPLLDVVGRLGLNQQTFLERFYGEPKEFAKAVTELNTALEKERLEADKLVKSLQAVVRVQGVLSIGQINAISATRAGSPAEGPLAEFFASQRQQAGDGLSRAVEALTRNASLSQAESEALTKGVRDQEERDRILEDALGRKAKQTLTDFGAGAKAASAGLFVLFDEAVRRGDSAVDALSNLREPIGQLRDLYSRAGLTPGAGFQQLSGLFDIATGDQTGTAVQLASGLGSALSAFQNQGLLSQDLFADLTSGISESFFTLEALGKGGLDAARLMQPGLQSIFQLQKDFGFEVDANTQKLLDFAESSGLIGDEFRPAAELMVDGINQVIDRLDVLIQTLGGDLPDASLRGGRSMDRNLNPGGPKTPSLPSVPDPGGNGGMPDPSSFRVEIGDTTVLVNLDGDVLAEAMIRRMPGAIERVS